MYYTNIIHFTHSVKLCYKYDELIEKLSKERQTATCSASFGCVWSLGSLTTLRSPTNGP